MCILLKKLEERLLILLLAILLTGCSQRDDGRLKLPLVYRVDIQQGNIIEQSMLVQLKPGLDKNKVRFIMGTPLLVDPFHSDRWDYIYSYEPGSGEREQRRVSIFFIDDKLSRVEGDVKAGVPEEVLADESSNIFVPIERNKKGFFSRLFGSQDELAEAEKAATEDGESNEKSAIPLPERDPERIEKDIEILEETGGSLE